MTTPTDRRAEMLLNLMQTRQSYTTEARGYLTLADNEGACDCDPDDGCECGTWTRETALSAANTAALLAHAAGAEMAALTAWWGQPAA